MLDRREQRERRRNMSLEENKAIVRSIFEDGLNKGEVDKVTEMTAPDFFDHDIHVETGIPGGPEDLREALVAIRKGFPDIDVTIEDIIAEGEFNGIPATGRQIEIGGIVIWRIADDKIAERWATIDTLSLLQQLGVIPTPEQSEEASPT
jgi:predicted ester cyclase